LEKFSGPLDLLLTLISKHKLNILDIEISVLLEQYLLYLENIPQIDYEEAGEFLEMAARLVYIKTVSLLPKKEEAESAKRQLTQELIEYAECKRLAEMLKNAFTVDIFTRKPMKIEISPLYALTHSVTELAKAYLKLPDKEKRQPPIERKDFRMVEVPVVSVISKAVCILRTLIRNGQVVLPEMLMNIKQRSERVATFLAVLELSKYKRIYVDDDNRFISIVR
jgi:segregation and condensation protein A